MVATPLTLLFAMLAAGAQQPASPVPSAQATTLTDAVLARDTWNMILRSEGMIELLRNSGETRCQARKLSRIRVVEVPQNATYKEDGSITRGTWKEEWLVDRCGKLFAYTIQFTATGGGTRIGVEHPFNPTPIP